ncbi:TatD family hydrolase [Coraliomargarita parva]|uniref:TatD family hydrolase n=1 Tax=Coraliomargarita parva TaxID=3014050 RepID=UPI0022B3EEAC|nr:TatD family hydrolase [Coraliomargarita parva]
MNPPLYDAHCHWADARLQAYWSEIAPHLEGIQLQGAVVNGTSPDDWPAVLALAERDSRVLPSIGLHPWRVNQAPAGWREQFLDALDRGARGIGEIGLDQWIEGHDIQRQQAAFRWQLKQAAERNLPASIHCLKATGPLLQTLRSVELPARGIHLHALNASLEVFDQLTALGAYFSFNSGQLKSGSHKVREAIRFLPADRILVETDAPDFLPPPEYRQFSLPKPPQGQEICHPANLCRTYEVIAELGNTSTEALAKQIEVNFLRFFGAPKG